MTTGLGLIIAIGAQNVWVIRQGIRRERIGLVVAICILCDALLIAAGTAGIGFVTRFAPWLLTALRWGGVVYLLWFAWNSAASALSAHKTLAASPKRSASSIVWGTLAVSLLNPHVYLDTVVMLGTVTNTFGADKWSAGLGAMTASTLWFSLLGWGARAASRILRSPLTWRIIDGIVALIMVVVAATLAFGS